MLKEKSEAELISLGILHAGENREDAMTKASKDMKKYKDLATDDYIESNKTSDGALEIMLQDRANDLKNYNEYAADDKKIPTRVKFDYDDGGTIISVDKEMKDLTAKEYDEYIKQVAKKKTAEISREIADISAKQENIKRQTAGSGINEGKK